MLLFWRMKIAVARKKPKIIQFHSHNLLDFRNFYYVVHCYNYISRMIIQEKRIVFILLF